MRKTRTLALTGALLALLLAGGPASAQTAGGISLDEFVSHGGHPDAFRQADADRNGLLDDSEHIKARAISDRQRAGEYAGDTWITTKVKTQLLTDTDVGLAVGVETQNGVVQLSGFVDTPQQAARAVDIAARVTGVKKVINALVVGRS